MSAQSQSDLLRFLTARPRRRWVDFVFAILSGLFASGADAQRLEIRVEGETSSVVPIIWGRLTDDFVLLGGESIRRTRDKTEASRSRPPAPVAAAPSATEPAKAAPARSTAPLDARYTFRAEEKSACGATTRFKSFATLLGSLAKRVESIRLLDAEGWDACANNIAASLEGKGFVVERDADSSAETLSVVVRFQGQDTPTLAATSTPPDAAKQAQSAPAAAAANVAGPPQVSIAGRLVTLEKDGYFVFVSSRFRELEVEVAQPGYEPLHRRIAPTPLAVGTSEPPPGSSFSEIVVVSRADRTSIAVLALPPSARLLVLDMTTGLGLGYGHGLPGEVRGRRGALAAAVTHRDLIGGIGGRISLEASSASDSSVPWTVLGKAVATIRGDFWDAAGVWRLGGGGQTFLAKIAPNDKASPGEQAVVPELVMSPLIVSAIELRLSRLVVAGALEATPLYVAGAGFYPSLNPALELGGMVDEGAALMLGYGVTRIRYPAIGRETSLRLDTLYLSLRQGF